MTFSYPWATAEETSQDVTHAVQVALDRRDNGGESSK